LIVILESLLEKDIGDKLNPQVNVAPIILPLTPALN